MPTLQELMDQLKNPTQQSTAPNYDAQYEQSRNSIYQGLAGLQSEQELRGRRLGEDYDVASRDLAQNQEKQKSALQEKLANQGILRSGINVGEQGRRAQQYQQDVGALTQHKTRSQEDLARDVASRQQGYQDRLAEAEVGRADRQTAAELKRAQDEATALANKQAADQQRIWMEELQQKLIQDSQPQPSPTGQMQPAPPPQQIIQQAIQQLPQPRATATPQQQISNMGISPRDLQQMLKIRGFDPGIVDGIFGKKSQQALALWKQSVGLPADANIDPDIWQRLQSTGTNVPGGSPTRSTGPMVRAV